MKIKRRKEDIRNQILKKIEYYRNNKGIQFFDDANNQYKGSIKLDDNEIEVLLIRLNRLKKVLLTTKCLYIVDKNSTTKISGKDIDRFDYMEFINGEKIIEVKSKIKIMLLRFKMNFRIGNYRIVKNNGSFIELVIKRTRFADCLNDCIKKLKFVGNKYEGI